MKDNIEFIQFHPDRIDEINYISQISFGEGFHNNTLLIKPSNEIHASLIQYKAQIIGYAIGIKIYSIFPTASITKYQNVIIDYDCHLPVYLIKEVAVLPNFQKKGLGSALLENQMQEAISNRCRSVFYFLWKEGGNAYFKNKLTGTGFELKEELANFWYKESLEQQYSCPVCGTPPCKCHALVYEYKAS
jgi:GNAT superfamily N-acetyltransferase